MTWQGTRRKQLPSNWGQIRRLVLELDGYRCTAESAVFPGMRCGGNATDVDHANAPDDHRLVSLRSLCDLHHKQKTNREAIAARALKSRARPTARHPGLR